MAYGNGNGGGNGGNNGTNGGVGGAQDDSDVIYSFKESGHKFTDPIRYYKANDPYYWEIDNIPLQQIHENCLWLQDQIQGRNDVSGIRRSQIFELKPHAEGNSRSVLVEPGNFIGRVNDAYGHSGREVTLLRRPGLHEDNDVASSPDTRHSALWRFKYQSAVVKMMVGSLDAFGGDASLRPSNGLDEHIGHYGMHALVGHDTPRIMDWGLVSRYHYGNADGQLPSPDESQNNISMADVPGIKTFIWRWNGAGNDEGQSSEGATPIEDLPHLHANFVQRWGGTARTAVVNIDTQLQIEIPPFEESDWLDFSDNYTPNLRIDLLFIYTRPVDVHNTYLPNPRGDTPRLLTQPVLGLVKGAGQLAWRDPEGPNSDDVDFTNLTTGAEVDAAIDALPQGTGRADRWKSERILPEGYEQVDNAIVSKVGDMVNAFQPAHYNPFPKRNLYGSFPSPDDLMNIAPLLMDDLGSGSLAQLGQSVLPVAYIIVKKDAEVITNDDVIDIRPFFRTTELAYNERAGIAAATPPLSFSNPAVGKEEVHNIARTVKNDAEEMETRLRAEFTDMFNLIVGEQAVEKTLMLKSQYNVGTLATGTAAAPTTRNISDSVNGGFVGGETFPLGMNDFRLRIKYIIFRADAISGGDGTGTARIIGGDGYTGGGKRIAYYNHQAEQSSHGGSGPHTFLHPPATIDSTNEPGGSVSIHVTTYGDTPMGNLYIDGFVIEQPMSILSDG